MEVSEGFDLMRIFKLEDAMMLVVLSAADVV
jgi:hypothetical protein